MLFPTTARNIDVELFCTTIPSIHLAEAEAAYFENACSCISTYSDIRPRQSRYLSTEYDYELSIYKAHSVQHLQERYEHILIHPKPFCRSPASANLRMHPNPIAHVGIHQASSTLSKLILRFHVAPVPTDPHFRRHQLSAATYSTPPNLYGSRTARPPLPGCWAALPVLGSRSRRASKDVLMPGREG